MNFKSLEDNETNCGKHGRIIWALLKDRPMESRLERASDTILTVPRGIKRRRLEIFEVFLKFLMLFISV